MDDDPSPPAAENAHPVRRPFKALADRPIPAPKGAGLRRIFLGHPALETWLPGTPTGAGHRPFFITSSASRSRRLESATIRGSVNFIPAASRLFRAMRADQTSRHQRREGRVGKVSSNGDSPFDLDSAGSTAGDACPMDLRIRPTEPVGRAGPRTPGWRPVAVPPFSRTPD